VYLKNLMVHNNTDEANGLPSITSTIAIKRSGPGLAVIDRDANAPGCRLVHVAAGGSLSLERR